jgi:hypothetical protein
MSRPDAACAAAMSVRVPSVGELLSHYRDAPRAELKSWLFRQWALRADSDPWGILAGQAFDVLEALDHVGGAPQ